MIAAVDVYYFETAATAAGVLFSRWTSERPAVELREFIEKVEPYEPGSFYKRELPCLLKLLQAVKQQVETIVVDGYVWLGPGRQAGAWRSPVQGPGQTDPGDWGCQEPIQGSR